MYQEIESAIDLVAELGVRRLKTGISWADYHRPGGRPWYDWQMATLRRAGLDVLLSVWHTPPSVGDAPREAAVDRSPRPAKAGARGRAG